MSLISVIIPNFNSGDKLKRLIDSIPSEGVEIIVIDDNSSEAPVVPQSREVVMLSNTTGKKGAGSCRNLGLSKAKGEYVLFADSDDYFLPDAFSIIEKYKVGKDIIYFSPQSIVEGTDSPSKRHLYYEKLIKKQNMDMIKTRFHVPWSKLYLRSFIEKNQLQFDEVIASNDVMFSAKAGVFARTIDSTSDSIYCVTCSNNSLTKIKSKSVRRTRLNVVLNFNRFLNANNFKHCAYSMLEIIYAYRDVITFKDVMRLMKGSA
ncbi:TPA: glycosyltransferase family 2 protein [Vibrio campbellii]|uniref:glycosyltransferase family 2 protein n=1 Tax=Vibrio owensii TaxID=696485 RepID=UPI003308E822|nr:glycosyltransferase family 2 protein [Vibrio campbellii]